MITPLAIVSPVRSLAIHRTRRLCSPHRKASNGVGRCTRHRKLRKPEFASLPGLDRLDETSVAAWTSMVVGH